MHDTGSNMLWWRRAVKPHVVRLGPPTPERDEKTFYEWRTDMCRQVINPAGSCWFSRAHAKQQFAAINLSISLTCYYTILFESGLTQLDVCKLVTICWKKTYSKSVKKLQPTCRQEAVATHANASWYRLVDQAYCKMQTDLLQHARFLLCTR